MSRLHQRSYTDGGDERRRGPGGRTQGNPGLAGGGEPLFPGKQFNVTCKFV